MANHSRSHQSGDESVKPVVVLLHGALRTRFSMLLMQRALEKAGFETFNSSYRWRDKNLAEIADELAEKLSRYKNREIHFVTHSLGGLVARVFLQKHKMKSGRLVMLGPPNRGSCIAHFNDNNSLIAPTYRAIYGQAAKQLTPREVEKLPLPSCEFGVIAGGRGKKKGYSRFLPGDNDAVVLVEETKLPGMADFVLVPHTHTFMMNGRDTIKMTIQFLKTGKFR